MAVIVDVCVCTYRRPSLLGTLESIARQRLPEGIAVRVIVADNDDVPSARDLVQQARSAFGLDCVYLHAPARNIAVARNACLDAADAPLMAFIDDDETATETWLAQLVSFWRLFGDTIIFGPVEAVYPIGPAWLRKADLHSIMPVIRKGGQIATGYTSNVLIDRSALADALRACRFDPELGRSGGEDTVFFHALHNRGARLGYCVDALVNEVVTPHRARLGWLLKRSFRAGQTHCRVSLSAGGSRAAMTFVAAAKVAYCLIGAGAGAASPSGWRRALVRGALHAGVFAGSLGMSDLLLY